MTAEAIKRGSVTVKVYCTPTILNGAEYSAHTVRWSFNGQSFKRKFGKKNSHSRAVEFAETKAIQLANGETALQKLTDSDAASYARAKELLQATGVPIEIAAARFAEDHAKRQKLSQSPQFAAVADEFIARKTTDGTRARHLADIENMLEILKPMFPHAIGELTASIINTQLDGMQTANKWGNRTRNHYRSILMNCCNYARAHHHLPRDWHEFDFVPKLKEKDGAVTIYTPEQVVKYLAKVKTEILPAVVCSFFAGIRHSEIMGSVKDGTAPLDWRDINFETGDVFVAEGKVRTAGQRFAHLPDNALRWLRTLRRVSGPVCAVKNLAKRLGRTARKAKMQWQHNVARHSYISYRLAETKDIAKVSEETGTDAKTLRRRYRRPIPQTEAKKYFAIEPRRSRKVTSLKKFSARSNFTATLNKLKGAKLPKISSKSAA